MTGGGNLSASRTLSLATVGTAGTYTKVIVDAYGRVTGHSALAESDIPILSIAKISGLQTSLDSKLNASVFNDLFEKVTEDGNTFIKAKYNFYSVGEVAAGGSGSGGSTGGGIDEAQLWEILGNLGSEQISKTHLTDALNGYATEEWVENKGYLTSYTNNYLTSVSGNGNSTVTFARQGLTSLTWNAYHAHAFASLTDKPTTLAGYGITDAYTKTDSDSRYVNVYGDTMTGRLTIIDTSYYAEPLVISGNYNTNGTLQSYMSVKHNNVYKTACGWDNYRGSFIYDFTSNKYLTISNAGILQFGGNQVLDAGNYSTTLDTRYVKKSGDIMTGTLYMPHALVGISEADANKYAGSNTYYNLAVGWKEPHYGLSILLYRPDSTKQTGLGFSTTNADHAALSLEANSDDLYLTNRKGGVVINALKNNIYPLILKGGSTFSVIDIQNISGTSVAEVGWLNDSRGNSAYMANVGSKGIITVANDGLWFSDNSATFRKYKVWHAGNDGSGSGLDADLLDGYHSSGSNEPLTCAIRKSNGGLLVTEISFPAINFPKDDPPRANISPYSLRVWDSYNQSLIDSDKYGVVLEVMGRSNHWDNQLYFRGFNGGIYHRQSAYSDSTWTYSWNKIAYTTDNVASATKLQTPRTIWGQSFDGTANVSGALTGVTSITASGAIAAGSFRLLYPDTANGIAVHRILNWPTNPYGILTRLYSDGTASLQSQRENNNNECFNLSLNPLGGNVGIGTTSPSHKLHVVGNIYAATANVYASNIEAYNGYLKSICNGKTITIYSQNASYCHYMTDAPKHWFNTSVDIQGNLTQYHPNNTPTYTCGTSSSRWLNIFSVYGNFSDKITAYNGIDVVSGYVVLSNGWFQNNQSAVGLYNSAADARWYADGNGWNTDKSIVLRTSGGSWISGKTSAPIMTRGDSSTNGNSYHPIIWGRTTAGNVWNFSHGATDQVGFFGFYSGTTANRTDWQTYITISTGDLYHSKSLTVAGNIAAYGEVAAGSSSDRRLKKILSTPDYRKRLLSLGDVVDYEYNDKAFQRNARTTEHRRYTGLIYQNVVSVLPQMAGKDDDGYGYLNYIHTDYINLIAGALQQTIRRQETIEQRVARLEKENAELKQQLKRLAA